jgi:hypothetical protein
VDIPHSWLKYFVRCFLQFFLHHQPLLHFLHSVLYYFSRYLPSLSIITTGSDTSTLLCWRAVAPNSGSETGLSCLLLEETQDCTEQAALRNRLVLEMYPVRTAASQQFMSTDAFVGFPQPSSSNINWTELSSTLYRSALTLQQTGIFRWSTNSPPDTILSQFNPVHILTAYLANIRFNIIRSLLHADVFPLSFSSNTCNSLPDFHCMHYAQPISNAQYTGIASLCI